MSWLCARAATRSCACPLRGPAGGNDFPPHTAPCARRALVSTNTASSRATELAGQSVVGGGGAGGVVAVDVGNGKAVGGADAVVAPGIGNGKMLGKPGIPATVGIAMGGKPGGQI